MRKVRPGSPRADRPLYFLEGSVVKKTDGYTTDVHYPAFFYKEMQPLWLSTVAQLQGVGAPDVRQPFSLCELGCGVGINLLVSAACHPQASLVGVDVHAEHVRMARAAAQAAGLTNVSFVHSDFATFARQHTQQRFDFMSTHGVWSWIAPPQQEALLSCVHSCLQPQGLFYLHYMCHPGSTDLLTVQHFLHLFAPHVPGSSAQQAQMGLKLLCQLGERGLFHDRPGVLKHLRNLQSKAPNDLAHEFLTDHWQPQHSVAVHQRVAQLGLQYLGSADVFNNLDIGLSIPGNMQSVIRQTRIPEVAETLKDLARNSHQRMDLFQRQPQPQPLSAQAQRAWRDGLVFALLPGAPSSGAITFATPIGPIEGPAAVCDALLQRLAAGAASFAQLAQLPVFAGQEALLLQTLQLMMGQDIVHPVLAALSPDMTADPGRPPAADAESAASPQVRGLMQWLHQQRLALHILPACATAVRTSVPVRT